jgi:hypothetical protein
VEVRLFRCVVRHHWKLRQWISVLWEVLDPVQLPHRLLFLPVLRWAPQKIWIYFKRLLIRVCYLSKTLSYHNNLLKYCTNLTTWSSKHLLTLITTCHPIHTIKRIKFLVPPPHPPPRDLARLSYKVIWVTYQMQYVLYQRRLALNFLTKIGTWRHIVMSVSVIMRVSVIIHCVQLHSNSDSCCVLRDTPR